MAAAELRSLGISMAQAWVELEKAELEALFSKSLLPLELYRYGRPVLLSTRTEIVPERSMTDARGNTFLVQKSGILTQLYADKVMSIPAVSGAAANLYDLRHADLNEKDSVRFNFDFIFS